MSATWGDALAPGTWANGTWDSWISTLGATVPCWADGAWAIGAWKTGAWRGAQPAITDDGTRFNGGGGHFGSEYDYEEEYRKLGWILKKKKKKIAELERQLTIPQPRAELTKLLGLLSAAQNEMTKTMMEHEHATQAYKSYRSLVEDDDEIVALLL